MQPKIYDCFLYNGESKMLNFRLNELSSFVEKFVIVESTHTFKGDKKQLKFNCNNFESFSDKIVYKVCDILPTTNAWENEKNQRNFLKEGFRNINLMTNDYILISDVDEIPDTNVINEFAKNQTKGAFTFHQHFFYYNTKCKNVNKWPGTVIIDVDTFLSRLNFNFEMIRNARHSLKLIGHNEPNAGGWHFSYFGDVDYIIDKIKSFSHQEYNNERYTNPKIIQDLIESGKDLFFRENEHFNIIEHFDYMPNHISLLR